MFFVGNVLSAITHFFSKKYFHIFLIISNSEYPGLVTGMQMNWMCDWSQSALLGDVTYFIHKHNLARDSSSETR